MARITYRPGTPAPHSGQYPILDAKGRETGQERTLVKGRIFPPPPARGQLYGEPDLTKLRGNAALRAARTRAERASAPKPGARAPAMSAVAKPKTRSAATGAERSEKKAVSPRPAARRSPAKGRK